MTQVKEWSNQELNRKLTELLGYKVVKDEATGMHRMVNPQGKEFGMSRPTEGLVWNDYAYPFCTDPAASLEVQTAACAIDKEGYIRNLVLVKWGESPILYSSVSNSTAADIACARPRERAEAAYITLQGAKRNV
jgi:hypothetical protein